MDSKTILCLALAGAAALLIQLEHWSKIYKKPLKERERHTQRIHFVISGAFVAASALLGLVAKDVPNNTVSYALAASVGFAPWATIRMIVKRGTVLGNSQQSASDNIKPATFEEFIKQ